MPKLWPTLGSRTAKEQNRIYHNNMGKYIYGSLSRTSPEVFNRLLSHAIVKERQLMSLTALNTSNTKARFGRHLRPGNGTGQPLQCFIIQRHKATSYTTCLIRKNTFVSPVNEILTFATIYYIFNIIVIWTAGYELTYMPGYELTGV